MIGLELEGYHFFNQGFIIFFFQGLCAVGAEVPDVSPRDGTANQRRAFGGGYRLRQSHGRAQAVHAPLHGKPGPDAQ